MSLPFELRDNVPLAPLTTLEVGGVSRYLATCRDLAQVKAALAWGRERRLPIFVLGGGSNLLVADGGFQGLTVRYADTHQQVEIHGDRVLWRLGAGHVWDAAVEHSVAQGWAGIECLSGIPGLVGAAPLQNIGAYGQEVAETLESVSSLDLDTAETRRWTAAQCGLGYRTSIFKGAHRGRYLITGIELRLARVGEGSVRYRELARRLADGAPTVANVRRHVLAIRREKSMVWSEEDANRRSAGSFFVNPVVSAERAAAARDAWLRRGGQGDMPAYDVADGVKLSAAWLIERAGFVRGTARGAAGISSRHTLALINRGAAKAVDLLALAAEIRRKVYDDFGVTLVPEPYFLGFDASVDELLGCPSRGVSPRILA